MQKQIKNLTEKVNEGSNNNNNIINEEYNDHNYDQQLVDLKQQINKDIDDKLEDFENKMNNIAQIQKDNVNNINNIINTKVKIKKENINEINNFDIDQLDSQIDAYIKTNIKFKDFKFGLKSQNYPLDKWKNLDKGEKAEFKRKKKRFIQCFFNFIDDLNNEPQKKKSFGSFPFL